MTTKIKDNSAMTIANKTLSDKEIYFWDNKTEMYKKEDVKEFLRLVEGDLKNNCSEKRKVIEVGKVIEIIKFRAGNKFND